MKRVLILGSGLSKALNGCMPTVRDLGNHLLGLDLPYRDTMGGFRDDPELLLSYLAMNHPWKTRGEFFEDRAVFESLQSEIAKFIEKMESESFRDPPPDWSVELVRWLHESGTPVLTLNYDTVLERVNHLISDPSSGGSREFHLYGVPLSPLALRESGVLAGNEVEAFRLLKLHGSINWFYSGADTVPGEQIYYRAVASRSPLTDYATRIDPSGGATERRTRDKVPLLIPPVAEKSTFYANTIVRSLWREAADALEAADEVFCVGYSLPSSDMTMRMLLRRSARAPQVFVVNEIDSSKAEAHRLFERFRDAFRRSEVDVERFVCKNSVERMVESLTQ